ncbi:hypothetical protein pdam_00023557 [Pocillopora damicornis]|uniref:Uncharacterized protein n=1 Tax=Pocillopora damicornis TaxID=46731 RepID=A0A3M6V682_POCDA|nr:hypothetical protein pdam_00023557 [Pocillopora damicornis]
MQRINCSPPHDLPYCSFEFAKESCEMASNKRDLIIISIAQLVIAGILFVLGMVDHFEVRFMYASLILMPIWIALLVRTYQLKYKSKYLLKSDHIEIISDINRIHSMTINRAI